MSRAASAVDIDADRGRPVVKQARREVLRAHVGQQASAAQYGKEGGE